MKFKRLRAELKAWSRNLSNLSLLINNCNKVIGFLDSLEDRRLLYNTEINLRNLVKKHLRTLLHYKKEYWRKRFTNNKVKFGDECTKFFHSMATISYKRNTITQIRNDTGIWVQDHSGKARLLLNAFKNRVGISSEINQHFDLHNLIQHRDNLEALAEPFLHEEIDDIIKYMPTDKAPGPDGFNGLFMKKCWPIIKEDFYSLCQDFYSENLNLEGINTSYIILVPKITNPKTVNDYRPISLVNISLKLLAKLLANRLQREIIQLIHKNQYGFIKTRTIQDCLAWSFEYIHQCHHSKREALILKLDFEKAFDTVEHEVIIQMINPHWFSTKMGQLDQTYSQLWILNYSSQWSAWKIFQM